MNLLSLLRKGMQLTDMRSDTGSRVTGTEGGSRLEIDLRPIRGIGTGRDHCDLDVIAGCAEERAA